MARECRRPSDDSGAEARTAPPHDDSHTIGALLTQQLMETLKKLESGEMVGATKLSLANLKLGSLPTKLVELSDLEILDISGNCLTSLPKELPKLSKLRILFASNNSFDEVPTVLGMCNALEMVAFRGCGISVVTGESLPPNLRWLILTDNRISVLPSELGRRSNLQKLMLSCNQIKELPCMAGCKKLELIRLAGNQFNEVPALSCIESLKWAAIAGNPLTSADEEACLGPEFRSISCEGLTIHEKLGEGASGVIWRGTMESTKEEIAVKVYKAPFTSDGYPRSEMAAGLSAPRVETLMTPIAQVTGFPDGKLAAAFPLLSSKFVNLAGPPSFDTCTRDVYAPSCIFTRNTAERLLSDIRLAITSLHGRGVVHGDVYAHNILWDPSTGEAILSDFGAAVVTTSLPERDRVMLEEMEWRAFAVLEKEVFEHVM